MHNILFWGMDKMKQGGGRKGLEKVGGGRNGVKMIGRWEISQCVLLPLICMNPASVSQDKELFITAPFHSGNLFQSTLNLPHSRAFFGENSVASLRHLPSDYYANPLKFIALKF